MTEDHDSDAIRVFWENFDSTWRDGGALPAEEISTRLQREQNYSLAVSTVRGWLEHNRLPRKDDDFNEMCLLFVGKDRSNELMALLQAARRARTPRTPTRPDSPPPTRGTNKPAVIWRQLYRSLRPWHAAAAVAVVVPGVLVVVLGVLPDDEAPPGTSTPPTPSTIGTGPSAAPDDSPCPTPTVQAESKKSSRAHATFCTDRLDFLLFDDSSDGKSAILVVRVNGEEWPAWFNSNGHMIRSPDGSQMIINPPQRIPVSFSSNDTVEFRVCAADRSPDYTYPEDTCGDWTPIWPPR